MASTNVGLPQLSGEFVRVYFKLPTAGWTEVSQYFDQFDPDISYDMQDKTTMRDGGKPVTRNSQRGAINSEPGMKARFSKAFMKILRQCIACRTGIDVRCYQGSNAAPTLGDEIYTASLLFLGFTLNFNSGSESSVDIDAKPADAGTLTPQLGLS